MFNNEIRQNLIDALCVPVHDLEITVGVESILQEHGIEYVAQLLTYNEKDLSSVFPKSPRGNKGLNSLYDELEKHHIKKWFNPLLSKAVREMNSEEELRAFVEQLPSNVFEKIMSEDMKEEGARIIAKRAEFEKSLNNILRPKLKDSLKTSFLNAVIHDVADELLRGDHSFREVKFHRDVKKIAQDVIARKLGLGSD